MKFETYIDKINTIMKDCAESLTRLDNDFQAELERIDKEMNFGNTSPAKHALLVEQRTAAGVEYRKNTADTIEAAQRQATDARADLEKDAKEFAAVHPADVDAATVALLNSGIMQDNDLVRLVNENGENVTMLRLLCAQAERLMEDSATARALVAEIKKFVDPESRLSVFDCGLANAHVGAGLDLIKIASEAWGDGGIYQRIRHEMQELDKFVFNG